MLSDLSSMQLVVPLSESEIGNVKVGQIATVTVEALSGAKLAAHVSEVALLSTSSSGVVSYDVTFQLDQLAAGMKLGMSATAEVVVKQAEGINVPTSAITADSVTVERSGKQVRQRVVTGLAGQHLDDHPQRPEGRRNGRAAGGEHDELEHQPDLADSAAASAAQGGSAAPAASAAAGLRRRRRRVLQGRRLMRWPSRPRR